MGQPYRELREHNANISSVSFIHRSRELLAIILVGLCFWPVTTAGSDQYQSAIQEFSGVIEGGHGVVYEMRNLSKGDVIYGYMQNTHGNLDPMLGVFREGEDPDIIYRELMEILADPVDTSGDIFSKIAERHFTVWDDDGGEGYDSMLQFTVEQDGTYYLMAGSMAANQALFEQRPTLTSGSYKLLLGLNAPDVTAGKGEPGGKVFAFLDSKFNQRAVDIQQVEFEFAEEKNLTMFHLRELQVDNTLYARLESGGDAPLPRFILRDFGGKSLAVGKVNEPSGAALLSYRTDKAVAGLHLFVDASSLGSITGVKRYQLTVGMNSPEVLEGVAVAKGSPILEKSKKVAVNLYIDQIVNIDQQSENFTIVGSLEMKWADPFLAFSPDECNCAVKEMEVGELKSQATKEGIILPRFIFFNQQGKRWSQAQTVTIDPYGNAIYQEKFTVTLQAPDFDFRAYPFDYQNFHIKIDLLMPTEVFIFEKTENAINPLGDQLGEEEWFVVNYSQEVEEVPYERNLNNSRFTTTLRMTRHFNYYAFRIFLPLILIISVSWVIFFLKDYGKQLDVASGNLLVFVAFNFTISNDVPRLGYLTLLDRLIFTSFCCAALVVFISVCQKRLVVKGREEMAGKIDKLVLIFYPMVYLIFLAAEYYLIQAG